MFSSSAAEQISVVQMELGMFGRAFPRLSHLECTKISRLLPTFVGQHSVSAYNGQDSAPSWMMYSTRI